LQISNQLETPITPITPTMKSDLLQLGVALLLVATLCVRADDEDDDTVSVILNKKPRDCPRETKRGDLVRVTFTVAVHDPHQTPIDNRYGKRPLEFVLGDGEMIQGFEGGIYDMCVGEERQIIVPPKPGYGENGLGMLPSRTPLIFQNVTLRYIGDNPTGVIGKDNVFKQIDTNDDELLSKDEVHNYLLSTGYRDVPGAKGVKQLIREIFHEEDHDRNTFISHKEFGGVARDEL